MGGYLDYDKTDDIAEMMRHSPNGDERFYCDYVGAHYDIETVPAKKLCAPT
jgi:hypothetical protein